MFLERIYPSIDKWKFIFIYHWWICLVTVPIQRSRSSQGRMSVLLYVRSNSVIILTKILSFILSFLYLRKDLWFHRIPYGQDLDYYLNRKRLYFLYELLLYKELLLIKETVPLIIETDFITMTVYVLKTSYSNKLTSIIHYNHILLLNI